MFNGNSPSKVPALGTNPVKVHFAISPKTIGLLVFAILSCIRLQDAHGQGGRAEVTPYDNGLQFEGERFSTQMISEAAFAREPFTAENIVVVDDGLRRIFLSRHHCLQGGGESNQNNEVTFDIEQRSVNADTGYGGFVKEGRFDEHGHRELTVSLKSKGKSYNKTFVQAITQITPRYCVLESTVGDKKAPREWSMRIATERVPKRVLLNMMKNQITDADNPNEHFKIASFFKQAKDFAQADEELLKIENRFPGQKERIRDERNELRQLRARFILQDITNRIDAGQIDIGLKMASFYTDKQGLAGEIQAQFQEIIDEQNARKEKLREARTKVMDLIRNAKNLDAEQSAVAKRLANELETELNIFNVARLDAFLQAADVEGANDAQKLSLVLSGWLLGTGTAGERLGQFQDLFAIRDLIIEYLQLETTKLRQSEILNELQHLEGASPKNVDAMLKQLKPYLEPTEAIKNYDAKKPLEFNVTIPGTQANRAPRNHKMLVHLPTGYDPYRKYPLLLSLPDGIQPLEQNLNLWCGAHVPNLAEFNVRLGEATRHGYIVAAVDYRKPGGQVTWGYSTREHLIVMKALKSCLQQFSVDSDRVFLSGHGVGAEGAYDIGSAHPEHWAGILGYSGTFAKYTNVYRENRHVHLPFYCVNGSKHVNAIRDMKDSLNKWIRTKKYNEVTAVHYRGRINEFFQQDIKHAVTWMGAQRRRWPDRNGFEFEVSSLRPTDNYFWFFEMHTLPEARLTRPEFFGQGRLKKLPISGEVKDNKFKLYPESYTEHDSTVWLSPDFVDFDKPIEIKKRKSFKGDVVPSVRVILDDIRRRADREHPFWARIDMKNRNWVAGKE